MARRIIFIILGAIFIIGGLAYGISSHQTTYKTAPQGTIAHYISDSGSHTGYLQMSDNSQIYVVNENSFTPVINGTDTLKDGDTISFVYDPDTTTSVDVSSTIGTHLTGTAYTVVELTFFDTNNNQTVYATSDYTSNPNGNYKNNWPGGGGAAAIGLVLVILGIVLPARKKQAGFSVNPVATMGQQPYQNPSQYQQPTVYPPQAGQYQQPQYPPQPGAYDATQVANPYQQPQYPPPPPNPYQ